MTEGYWSNKDEPLAKPKDDVPYTTDKDFVQKKN